MKVVDVFKIAGAGISGITAAVTLARAGEKVEVFEISKRPGARRIGDLEGLENWTHSEGILNFLRKIGVGDSFWKIGMREINAIIDGKDFVLSGSKDLFYVVKRGGEGSLDAYLWELAESEGVKIIKGKRAPEEVNIVATGADKPKAIGFGIVADTEEDDGIIVSPDREFAPYGYAYAIFAGGRATITVAIYKDVKKGWDYLRRFQEFLKNKGIRWKNERKFAGYVSVKFPKLKDGNKLFCGEAAGLMDPLMGFGMNFAFESGYLAAKSLLTGEDYESLAAHLVKRVWNLAAYRSLYDLYYFLHLPNPVKYSSGKDFYKILKKVYTENANILAWLAFFLRAPFTAVQLYS